MFKYLFIGLLIFHLLTLFNFKFSFLKVDNYDVKNLIFNS